MNRPIEEWRRIRALVEKGLSLNQAAKQFGLSFSHLQRRAAVEGWKLHGRGRPRTMDYPDGTRRVEMAKEQAGRDAQQAELLLEARVAIFDTKKAELVAQKILAQHSTMMKMALSELVVQTAEDLRSGEVRPKDRAMAMVALKTVCDRLFGWNREPDVRGMEMARTGGDAVPQGAVNLRLIATSPEELAAMAKAKVNLDDHDDDHLDYADASATDCIGQGLGPSVSAPEQPPATHGCPISEKEAPTDPVKEPAPPSRTVNKAAPLLAPEQPVQSDAPPSHAAQEQEARLAAIAKARAEHRGANWEKYR
jgi:hypothetical protein